LYRGYALSDVVGLKVVAVQTQNHDVVGALLVV
jgi:hypothetical protein